ncbi:hypothetical protein B0H11DRAFT_1898285 [Mycena galericulata]|nr:hypothetical protein B0H11DRAFT_1898285 [Mycena galericulata]
MILFSAVLLLVRVALCGRGPFKFQICDTSASPTTEVQDDQTGALIVLPPQATETGLKQILYDVREGRYESETQREIYNLLVRRKSPATGEFPGSLEGAENTRVERGRTGHGRTRTQGPLKLRAGERSPKQPKRKRKKKKKGRAGGEKFGQLRVREGRYESETQREIYNLLVRRKSPATGEFPGSLEGAENTRVERGRTGHGRTRTQGPLKLRAGERSPKQPTQSGAHRAAGSCEGERSGPEGPTTERSEGIQMDRETEKKNRIWQIVTRREQRDSEASSLGTMIAK